MDARSASNEDFSVVSIATSNTTITDASKQSKHYFHYSLDMPAYASLQWFHAEQAKRPGQR
jgi:hypothetical protein